jgi:hypothetical protein
MPVKEVDPGVMLSSPVGHLGAVTVRYNLFPSG